MLTLLPTPLGNLKDITIRALEALAQAEIVLCEDTRVAKRLIELLARDFAQYAPKLLEKKRFFSLHSHNEKTFLQPLSLQRLGIDFQNQEIVYMSDAGMPCISDPGAALLRLAKQHHIPYDILPGGSALTLAYCHSAFESDGFIFAGFLPHKQEERRIFLRDFFIPLPRALSLIVYESPHRILQSLEDIAFVDEGCEVFAIKEMTKLYQKSFHGSAKELLAELSSQNLKGEWVLVLKPRVKEPQTLSLAEVESLSLPPKIKAKLIAKITKQDSKTIYQQRLSKEEE